MPLDTITSAAFIGSMLNVNVFKVFKAMQVNYGLVFEKREVVS